MNGSASTETRPQPPCAVVVSTRNRGSKIGPMIESLLANQQPNFDAVIVDQSDGDETAKVMETYLGDPRVRYVRSPLRGTSRGRNLGISKTSAPIIAITDDDCIVPQDWVEKMREPFDRDAKVGLVFCNVDPVPVELPGFTPHIRFPESRTVTKVEEAWVGARRRLALGAGMAVRRTMLQDVLGFDELLGPGSTFPSAEDNDLAWRSLLRGWRVYEHADTTVIHDGFRSLEELRELIKRDHYAVGGTIAKYLKSGHWGITPVLASWIFRFGMLEPAQDVLAGRKPKGFRRPYMLLRGLAHGLRTPIDTSMVCYREGMWKPAD